MNDKITVFMHFWYNILSQYVPNLAWVPLKFTVHYIYSLRINKNNNTKPRFAYTPPPKNPFKNVLLEWVRYIIILSSLPFPI